MTPTERDILLEEIRVLRAAHEATLTRLRVVKQVCVGAIAAVGRDPQGGGQYGAGYAQATLDCENVLRELKP